MSKPRARDEGRWRVERRHRGGVWEWLADSRALAWEGFFYFQRQFRHGTLHLIDPRDKVIAWCKASDRAAVLPARKPRKRKVA
jgi:hypothetical protein